LTQKKRKSSSSKKKPYRHPIPARADLLAKLTEVGRPLKTDQLMAELGLKGQKTRGLLVDQLHKMVRGGQIIENRRGEYCLTQKLELVTGTVLGHRDGFGFVRRDEGGDDVFLSAREMRAVFDGDRIALRVSGADRRGRAEGQVVEILERGVREIAGQFIRERGIGIVVPDNPKISHRILVPKEDAGSARPGQMVIAEILDYPTSVEQPTGRIIRVIGEPDKKGIATDIAIHSNAIPNEWPRAVRDEAKAFGDTIPASAIGNRLDLRDTALVTIDGADARDFDDAVFCEPAGKGWRLLVAIADVAHYVQIAAPIDKEAIKRGTSVYFPDRVVPMLPEVLSNGLCSLNPKVDRLCMVCEMKVDAEGGVSHARFAEAVMRSQARLTYEEVNDFLSGSSSKIKPSLQQPLSNLHGLFKAFFKARQRRGAIELDIPQTRISLDEDGTVREIVAVERNDAHRLIEECMIAANVEAAKFLRKHRIPGLYRVHAKPDPERFEELRQYLLSLGLKNVPHPDHVEPQQFNKLLQQVADRPDSQAISMAMLRSLMHAEYTPVNIGHFGLSLDAYAHFTSPIRRYPDLLVHRAIRYVLRNGKAGGYQYDAAAMERLGKICSAHERRAEEATREVEAWLKCQFMQDKVGQTFVGVITGVTNFGVFVQIPQMAIDGLVHVTSLANDYYHFEAGSQSLVGERSGQRYKLGEQLEVTVARVDMDTRRIDFSLTEEAGAMARPARRGGGKRR
jgi:ribonuclease R